MRIPFARKATGLLRTLRAPLLHRRMVRSSIAAEPTAASAMIVAPHPDDETFACGGVIALRRRQSVPVTIVFVTDGAASHPDRDPAELTRLRQAEALSATALLGVPPGEVFFLDGPDGGLMSLPADGRAARVRRLSDLIAEKRPAEIYVPHHHDRHPDHEAVNRMTRQAIALAASNAGTAITLLEYPIWLLWWAPLNQRAAQMNLDSARRIDISAVAEQKSAAIAVYRSQLPTMPWKFTDQFTGGFELFFAGDRPDDPPA
jgi:LmbE family N-acetylglucosaminyl deacetylase